MPSDLQLPMADDIAISVRNLTKTYRLFNHPGDRVKQFLSLGFRQYHRKFTALEDVSFDIRKGETVGIIGRNGSGKSTLLQLICGILKPTSGSVRVNGRISALLELGAGFNPEFTGRENVYFQGALMGFTSTQMDDRFDDIAAFADIGEFIDQPVRTYSSGMYVRLAFATVIHSEADILVVDEALAVGDEVFQRKCFERLETLLGNGKTNLFFVSHNIRQVERICSRAFSLERGRVCQTGSSDEVCTAYFKNTLQNLRSDHTQDSGSLRGATSGEVEVLDISIAPPNSDKRVVEVAMHAPMRVVIKIRCHSHLKSPEIIVGFHTTDSIYVASSSTAVLEKETDFKLGEYIIECLVPDMMLVPGVYHIRLAILDSFRRSIWDGHKLHPFSVIPGQDTNVLRMPQMSLVDIPFQWHFATISQHSGAAGDTTDLT